jgi:hypothetical protein
MIQIIAGKKGSGKTKRLIDMTNNSIKDAKADVVFIDDDNRYMFDINSKVRFINAGEYPITTAEAFLGFISGMLAQNFDVGLIFIDAFKKLVKIDLGETQSFFESMNALCIKHNVDFVLSVSEDPALLPEFMKAYII